MSGKTTARLCSLELAVGMTDTCPEEACPFWEPGGAVLDGRCAFERFDPDGLGSVAGVLLNIREQLASASSSEEAQTELSRLHHLLNESSE